MSKYENILIDAPLEGPEYERIFKLKDNPLLTGANQITLVNVYNSSLENSMPKDVDPKDFDQVEYVILEKLNKLRSVIDPEEKLKWDLKALFNKETKNSCCYFAKEIEADLVIIPTKGIKQSHLHNESFAQYMLESCEADLLVLKP